MYLSVSLALMSSYIPSFFLSAPTFYLFPSRCLFVTPSYIIRPPGQSMKFFRFIARCSANNSECIFTMTASQARRTRSYLGAVQRYYQRTMTIVMDDVVVTVVFTLRSVRASGLHGRMLQTTVSPTEPIRSRECGVIDPRGDVKLDGGFQVG